MATSLGALERERKAIEGQVQSVSEFQAMYETVQNARKMRYEMSRGEIPLLGLFKELGIIVPETMTLERFSIIRKERKLLLSGAIHGLHTISILCFINAI